MRIIQTEMLSNEKNMENPIDHGIYKISINQV